MMIRGRVRDIQPNQAQPSLELYFKKEDRSALPQGRRARVTLNLRGKRWYGTINSTNENNPPYLHTRLSQDSGATSTCKQVFLDLGLAEGAILEFECEPDATLRLAKIVDPGKCKRTGNREASNRSQADTAPKRRLQNRIGRFGIQDSDIEGRCLMTLEEALVLHGRANLTETNDWYKWPINPYYLPPGAILPEGSHYEKNIALKIILASLYSSTNDQSKIEIIQYYIEIWGGIKRNKRESIRDYAFNSSASLIFNCRFDFRKNLW